MSRQGKAEGVQEAKDDPSREVVEKQQSHLYARPRYRREERNETYE